MVIIIMDIAKITLLLESFKDAIFMSRKNLSIIIPSINFLVV